MLKMVAFDVESRDLFENGSKNVVGPRETGVFVGTIFWYFWGKNKECWGRRGEREGRREEEKEEKKEGGRGGRREEGKRRKRGRGGKKGGRRGKRTEEEEGRKERKGEERGEVKVKVRNMSALTRLTLQKVHICTLHV